MTILHTPCVHCQHLLPNSSHEILKHGEMQETRGLQKTQIHCYINHEWITKDVRALLVSFSAVEIWYKDYMWQKITQINAIHNLVIIKLKDFQTFWMLKTPNTMIPLWETPFVNVKAAVYFYVYLVYKSIYTVCENIECNIIKTTKIIVSLFYIVILL